MLDKEKKTSMGGGAALCTGETSKVLREKLCFLFLMGKNEGGKRTFNTLKYIGGGSSFLLIYLRKNGKGGGVESHVKWNKKLGEGDTLLPEWLDPMILKERGGGRTRGEDQYLNKGALLLQKEEFYWEERQKWGKSREGGEAPISPREKLSSFIKKGKKEKRCTKKKKKGKTFKGNIVNELETEGGWKKAGGRRRIPTGKNHPVESTEARGGGELWSRHWVDTLGKIGKLK